MFSEGLLFQKMLFCTANLFFTVTFFYLSFSNQHTNTDVFTLKSPSGAQSGCTTQINLLSQGSIEQEYLSENINFFEVLNENINFSTEFQYWIS